jgi:hypothetical protein
MTLYGDRKEKIRTILLGLAREGRTIFYKELGQLVGMPTAGPWRPVLEEISREEKSKGLPDITFLVVSKASGLPGQTEFNPVQQRLAKETIEQVFAHYRS